MLLFSIKAESLDCVVKKPILFSLSHRNRIIMNLDSICFEVAPRFVCGNSSRGFYRCRRAARNLRVFAWILVNFNLFPAIPRIARGRKMSNRRGDHTVLNDKNPTSFADKFHCLKAHEIVNSVYNANTITHFETKKTSFGYLYSIWHFPFSLAAIC